MLFTFSVLHFTFGLIILTIQSTFDHCCTLSIEYKSISIGNHRSQRLIKFYKGKQFLIRIFSLVCLLTHVLFTQRQRQHHIRTKLVKNATFWFYFIFEDFLFVLFRSSSLAIGKLILTLSMAAHYSSLFAKTIVVDPLIVVVLFYPHLSYPVISPYNTNCSGQYFSVRFNIIVVNNLGIESTV